MFDKLLPKRTKLGNKMLIHLIVPIMAIIILSVLSIFQINSISKHLIHTLYEELHTSQYWLLMADRDFYQAFNAETQMQSTENPKELTVLKNTYIENRSQVLQRVHRSYAIVEKDRDNFQDIRHLSSNKTLFELFNSFNTEFIVWDSLYNVESNTIKDKEQYINSFNISRNYLNEMEELLDEYTKNVIDETNKSATNVKFLIIVISILALIISTYATLYLGFKIANPISELIVYMNNVSKGDFECNIHNESNDEIGLAFLNFKCMLKHLKRTQEDISAYTKDLERKNTEMENFSYTISHDLKSPLITIKGFAGMISNDIKENNFTRIDADLKRIENAADKMNELLEGLLELSRIGRIANPGVEINMTELSMNIKELLYESLQEKNIKLEIIENMPFSFGDKNRIGEVIQNLLENAIKFVPKDSGKILIGYKNIDNKVVYFVKDNGIGIDLKYQSQIFNLFDKLDNNSPGSGIGLALVKRIIDFHNGEIWLESSPGMGSTFFFTLGENKDLSNMIKREVP